MQAPLETRGSGIGVLSSWQEQFFSLDAGVLESFPMEGEGHADQPLRRIPLQGITGLVLEPGSRECSFETNGLKVRLRARTDQEMHEWFFALQLAQVEAVETPDVLVHIAGIFGLARQGAVISTESKWYAVLRWRHQTSRYWTKEKAGVQSSNLQTDECHLKQTVRMQTCPGTRTLVVEVYRVGSGVGGSQRYGECTMDVADCNNHKMKDHPLRYGDGRLTGAHMRMRLRPTHEDPLLGADLSSPRAGLLGEPSPGAAGSKDSPRWSPSPHSPRAEPEEPGKVSFADSLVLTPSSAGGHSATSHSAASHSAASRSATSHSGTSHSAASRSATPHSGTSHSAASRLATPHSGTSHSTASRSTMSHSGTSHSAASRSGTPHSGTSHSATSHSEASHSAVSRAVVSHSVASPKPEKPKPQVIRSQTLYEDHASKQKKLEMQRLEKEQEEQRLIQERKEALMKKSRKGWDQTCLDPHKAADRLFADSKARDKELALKQQQYEEAERQHIEDRRFQKKGIVKSESAPTVAKEVGERLYKDQQRREQLAQKKREEKEARELQELEQSSSGPFKRCQTARGDCKRHNELYEYAAIQREVLERRRKEQQEAEIKKQNEAMVGASRTKPLDASRINLLFREHQEREQKKAFKKAELQTKELQQIEEEARRLRRKLSPRGGAGRAEQVSVTMELLDVDFGMLVCDKALVEQFQAAVGGAIAAEAGHAITADHVSVDFKEGSGPESSVVVQATVAAPNACVSAAVHAALISASSLGASVVGRLDTLDYVGTVSQSGTSLSDKGVTVSLLQQERQRTVPIWQRSVVQSRKDEPQEPAPMVACDPATQTDIVLNAVVSAIHMRCYSERTSTAAELKWLGAPLKAAIDIFKDALGSIEKGDGFQRLSATPSHRIFFDGQLIPEEEGWRTGSEPSPIRQVEENLDVLYEVAAKAQVKLGEMIAPAPGTVWEPGTSRAKPSGIPAAALAYNPGLKSRDTAELKAFVRYQPSDRSRSARHLLDLARFGLVFSNSQLVHKGLETIIKNFEVLSIRNYYNSPDRLGHRFLEVCICLEVEHGGAKLPHVCELRLEELAFETARAEAAPHLEQFLQRVVSVYDNCTRDLDAVAYLAHSTVVDLPESHGLRIFRRRFSKHHGSTVAGWRQNFGGSRQLTFGRFRDICRAMSCRKEAPEYWSRLDPGLSCFISIFEVDPDAVSLLVHIRSRIMMISSSDDVDPEELFRRLSFHVNLVKPGQLDIGEFRQVLRSFGFSIEVADRAFMYLDYEGGNSPASVSIADFAWLQRLSQLVDVDAVMLNNKTKLNDLESLRHLVSRRGGAGAGALPAGPGAALAAEGAAGPGAGGPAAAAAEASTRPSSAGAESRSKLQQPARRSSSQEPRQRRSSGGERRGRGQQQMRQQPPAAAAPAPAAQPGPAVQQGSIPSADPGPQAAQGPGSEDVASDCQESEDDAAGGEPDEWDVFEGAQPDVEFLEECF